MNHSYNPKQFLIVHAIMKKKEIGIMPYIHGYCYHMLTYSKITITKKVKCYKPVPIVLKKHEICAVCIID